MESASPGFSSNNTFGGTTSARNIISGNGGDGFQIVSASNNVVQGNFIGTDITGTQALGNQRAGVRIFGNSNANLIGGSNSGEGNLFAFNGEQGGTIDKKRLSLRAEI